jgi:hypothetical protein
VEQSISNTITRSIFIAWGLVLAKQLGPARPTVARASSESIVFIAPKPC